MSARAQGTVSRSSPIPLYEQLSDVLIADIVDGRLEPGDMLAGEHELCLKHGVSRTVVRRALSGLEAAGYIRRVQGKGTFVADPRTPEEFVHSGSGLFEDATQRGSVVRSVVLVRAVVPAPAEVWRPLHLKRGDHVVYLERLRYVDEVPWSLTRTYLPTRLAATIMDADLETGSLYASLGSAGVRTSGWVRMVEARMPDPVEMKLLGLTPSTPLLIVRSTSYDQSGQPIEYFIAKHRSDRSRFQFRSVGGTASLSPVVVQ